MSIKPIRFDCATHGHVPWEYDVVCAHCGRVYLDGLTTPPPERCACGMMLRPDETPDGGAFTGRACCHACAIARAVEQLTDT
jgi:hypothetical protein